MNNIENLTKKEFHFLACEGTLILSIVDENFWNKFDSYEECVNDFKRNFETSEGIQKIYDQFASYEVEDLKSCAKHLSKLDEQRLNLELLFHYDHFMSSLNKYVLENIEEQNMSL